MRTTVTLDDHLLDEVKLIAVRQGRTVGSVLEDAVRLLLERSEASAERRVSVPVFAGQIGLMPGVDLEDRDALHDLLDED
jgi:hypothetical protein